MFPAPWRFWSCSSERYCAFLAPRLRCKFDVFPPAPPAFLVRNPDSRAVGEQFVQMLFEGRSLLCASHVDDSGQMPIRLQTMSGWAKQDIKVQFLRSGHFPV